MLSESERYRELGNDFYRRATEDLSPAVRDQRLQKALLNYNLAFEVGVLPMEKASAAKNLGTAQFCSR